MHKATIGVDLGGTRIKTVALDADGELLFQLYTPTNDGNGDNWKQTVKSSIEEMVAHLHITDFVAGISAPGIAQSQKNVVMLTLGTGVGGALLIDGKPYQGSFQKAGHIGHISLNCENDTDITGIPGSLEDAIGNCTVEKRSHGKYKDTYSLLEAYRKGDHFARWVWLTSVRKLSIAIASISNMLSPECVVLGGGIMEAGNDLIEPLETFLSLYEWRPGGNKVTILKAQFNDMAGAIGAACFASVQRS